MVQTVSKWKITYLDFNGNIISCFHINDNFYSNILLTLNKIDCGIGVKNISIEFVEDKPVTTGINSK